MEGPHDKGHLRHVRAHKITSHDSILRLPFHRMFTREEMLVGETRRCSRSIQTTGIYDTGDRRRHYRYSSVLHRTGEGHGRVQTSSYRAALFVLTFRRTRRVSLGRGVGRTNKSGRVSSRRVSSATFLRGPGRRVARTQPTHLGVSEACTIYSPLALLFEHELRDDKKRAAPRLTVCLKTKDTVMGILGASMLA